VTHPFCLYANQVGCYRYDALRVEGGENVKGQYIIFGAASILTIMIITTAILLSRSLDGDSSDAASQNARDNAQIVYLPESTSAPDTAKSSAPANGSIAIPGYDTIRMKAGSQEQTVRLYNPADNSCYFLISIALPDGKEICRTDLIAPGDTVTQIRLFSELAPGTYKEATLIYSCFSKDDLHQMNGATVKTTLEVI